MICNDAAKRANNILTFFHTSQAEMDLAQCLSKKIRLYDTEGNTTQVAQITAYAPETFARLRSHFQIPEAEFMKSIFESGPYISYQSNSKGAARSGRLEGCFQIFFQWPKLNTNVLQLL